MNRREPHSSGTATGQAGDESRVYARMKPEGRVSKIAKILTGPKAPAIECTLIDYSVGGACVNTGTIPHGSLRLESIRAGGIGTSSVERAGRGGGPS